MKYILAVLLTFISPVTGAVWALDTQQSEGSLDSVLIAFYQEPYEAFDEARLALLRSDHSLSAEALEHGIKFIAMEAKYALELEGRDGLVASYDELVTLARRIHMGDMPSIDSFDDITARALYHLAYYQYQRAYHYWDQEKNKETGQAMHAALHNIRYAALIADYAFSEEMLRGIDEVRAYVTVYDKGAVL